MSGHRRRSAVPLPAEEGKPWLDLLRAAVTRELTEDDLEEWREKARRDRERRERNPAMIGQTVVYYVRFRDRIKIGYTRNLSERLAVLPHDEVLALEIGDREVEQMRHRQFAHLNEHGEWFRDAPELRAHAAKIREEYPWDS
jgi:hypothetical protein